MKPIHNESGANFLGAESAGFGADSLGAKTANLGADFAGLVAKVSDAKFWTSASSIANAPAAVASEVAILGRSNVGKSSLINAILGKNLAKSSATPGKTRLINFFTSLWELVDFNVEVSAESSADSNAESAPSAIIKREAPAGRHCENPRSGFVAINSVELRRRAKDECVIIDCHATRPTDAPLAMTDSKIPLTLIDLPGFGYAKVSKELKNQWQKNLMDFLVARGSIKLFVCLVDARHRDLAIDKEVEKMLLKIKKGDQAILKIYTKCDKLSQSELNNIAKNGAILTATQNDAKVRRKITQIPTLRAIILKKTLGA